MNSDPKVNVISKAKLEELKFKWKTEDSLPSGTLDECFKTISTLYQQNEEYAFHLRKAQERLSEVCKDNEELMKENELLKHKTMELSLHPCLCERMRKLERVAKCAKVWANKWEDSEITEDAIELKNLKTSLAALREGEK